MITTKSLREIVIMPSLSLHEYLDSETVLDGQCLSQRLKPLASTQSMCSCHIMRTVRGVKSSSILRAKRLHLILWTPNIHEDFWKWKTLKMKQWGKPICLIFGHQRACGSTLRQHYNAIALWWHVQTNGQWIFIFRPSGCILTLSCIIHSMSSSCLSVNRWPLQTRIPP